MQAATHANSNARFEHEVEWKEGPAKGCVWTCAMLRRLVSSMDDDDSQLIRQLCTRVGCIMEDTSVIALIWDDDITLDERLQQLSIAAADIQALVAAAKTFLPQ
jgi:hypothetical protein